VTLLDRLNQLDRRVIPGAMRRPAERSSILALLIAQWVALVSVFLSIYVKMFVIVAVAPIVMTISTLVRKLPPPDRDAD